MSDPKIEKVIRNLRAHGFEAFGHENRESVVQAVMAAIPPTASVSRCGSTTCVQLGFWEKLAARGNHIFDPYSDDKTPAEKIQCRRQGLLADVLLTGTNAITEDGVLVNIDGVGNRAAAQMFGPPLVLIVAGVNKIVADYPAAIHRTKTQACPPNARRMGFDTPCSRNLPCPPPDGCSPPARMCNAITIIERKLRYTTLQIHLVNETLGF